MNPYDFVPLGNPSPRLPPPGHHLLPSHGGVIHARLTTLGPFLIAKQADSQNTIGPVGYGKVIPGSSLKGMLRSVAEMAGGGCISLSGSLYFRGEFKYRGATTKPVGFDPCSDGDKLCVTCRMFGALIRGEAWKGMIEPGEARWEGAGTPGTESFNVIVGQPKPDHAAFYTKGGKIRGRKAYFHHPSQIIKSAAAQHAAFGARQTIVVRALKPGQTYRFSVRHQGLDRAAYALLLYSMFLQEGLAHKLGWGKPMGFGSVRIEVDALEEVDQLGRYRRGGDRATVRHEGEAAAARVREVTRELKERDDEVMVALRRMFGCSGPEQGKELDWAYPGYSWFKSNPQVSLEDFNAGPGQTTRKT